MEPKKALNRTPKILTSIKPLQLIAQAIMWDVQKVKLLFPSNSSPHHYQLKLSDRNEILLTDIFFWIGPNLESTIKKFISCHSELNHVIMISLPSIRLTKGRSQCCNHTNNKDLDFHKDSLELYDPHIWLDPENAIVIAQTMAQAFISLDSSLSRQKTYQSNLLFFEAAVYSAHEKNKLKTKKIKNKPFFVFHDAYSYLEQSYNLTIGDYFVLTPEQQLGTKHLINIQKKIQNTGTTCIFTEPYFRPDYLKKITNMPNVKIGELDPLGINIKPTRNGYVELLNNLITTICDNLSN